MPNPSPLEETGIAAGLRWFAAAGGGAGNITVTGIKVGDKLNLVYNVTDHAVLTSEFTITAADTINNAGGTATTGDSLLVAYWDNPNA